jgi:hypothetical protein
MTNRTNGNTLPSNAFVEDYLALLNERDEPITAPEAEYAGPWSVEARRQGGHAVLRAAEDLDRGDEPYAVFEALEIAQIAAAVLPGTGREKRYRLGKDQDSGRGFPVYRSGELAGHLRLFDEEVVAALNVLDALLSSPYDFAWLLEAAGGLALQHVGRISMARATGRLK